MPKAIIPNCIMKFFSFNENVEFSKINILFFNSFLDYYKEYIKGWSGRLKLLENKYDLNIPENTIDSSEEDAINKKRIYMMNDFPSNGIQIEDFNKFNHIALYNKVEWSWTNTRDYYTMVENAENALNGGPTRKLITVCWFDPKLSIEKVEKGNYRLFIRHGICGFSEDSTLLTIFLDDIKIKEMSYPNREFIYQFQSNPNILKDSLLCNIKEDDFKTENIFHQIKVNIFHKDNWWKNGLLLDGLILKKE